MIFFYGHSYVETMAAERKSTLHFYYYYYIYYLCFCKNRFKYLFIDLNTISDKRVRGIKIQILLTSQNSKNLLIKLKI